LQLEANHDPKDLAISVNLEASELLEHFQWTDEQAADPVDNPSASKRGLKHNSEQLLAYIKNIYKVLMSRGMKGCYVVRSRSGLQRYLQGRLSSIG